MPVSKAKGNGLFERGILRGGIVGGSRGCRWLSGREQRLGFSAFGCIVGSIHGGGNVVGVGGFGSHSDDVWMEAGRWRAFR